MPGIEIQQACNNSNHDFLFAAIDSAICGRRVPEGDGAGRFGLRVPQLRQAFTAGLVLL